MLSISHSSRYFTSRWIGSHLIRGGGKGLLPNFPKSLILKSVIFGKNIQSFLHRWRIHHSFFFFFVGIKSIDWIPPQNSSLEASIRPVLFIYPRLCKFDESGEEEEEETSMNFFPLPLFPFRINSRPNEANQSGERGDLNFSDAWPLRLTMDASIQPPGEQRNYSPSFIISNIYMCHRISFDETFNQTEPVARNVIRSCVFEEEWSKLRHCRRGGEGKDSFARK